MDWLIGLLIWRLNKFGCLYFSRGCQKVFDFGGETGYIIIAVTRG